MGYDKQSWADGPTGGTPIDADRLNHMEDGLNLAATTADAAAATAGSATTALATKADLVSGKVPLGQLPTISGIATFHTAVKANLTGLAVPAGQPALANVTDATGAPNHEPAWFLLATGADPTVLGNWTEFDYDVGGAAASVLATAETFATAAVTAEATTRAAADATLTTALTTKADLVSGKVPTAQLPALGSANLYMVASKANLTGIAVPAGASALANVTDATGAPNHEPGWFILNAGDSPTVLGNWHEFDYDAGALAAAAQAAAQTYADGSKVPFLNVTTVKTAAYNAVASDWVLVDITAQNVPVTLPSPAPDKCRIRLQIEAMSTSFAGFAASLIAGGTDHIDYKGVSVTTITRSQGVGQMVEVVYDLAATKWRIEGDWIPKAVYDALYAPSLLVPSDAVSGRNLFVVGNSYAAEPRSWVPMRFVDQVAARLKGAFFGGATTGGALAHDLAKWLFGTITLVSPNGVSQVETWNVSASNFGVGILEALRNDAGYDQAESQTKARAGFTNSLLALIRLMQAGTYYQDTNAAFAYTGTWAASVSGPTLRKGGSYHTTSTNGSYVIFTTPAACTDFDIILDGYDSAGGFNGAAITYQIDGGAVINATAQDVFAGQIYKHGVGETSTNLLTPIVIGGHGLASAVHTIKIVHNDAGHLLDVVGALIRSVNPLQILIGKAAKISSAAGIGYNTPVYAGSSWVIDQIYNGLIDAIVAMFPDGSVVSYDPMAYGWDPATCLMADGIHPNPLGVQVYTTAVMSVLNALPARAGLTYLYSP